MRFHRHEILKILPYLQLQEIVFRDRLTASPELAFSILLARLAWPRRNEDLEIFFGRSKTFISLIFNDTILHLYNRYSAIIEWHPLLTYEKLQFYAQRLNALGSSKIWGFIDGTFRKICRPKRNQQHIYSGYKKAHGFKYQGIATPDGMILSCAGPFEGRLHDISLYTLSGLETRLEKLFEGQEPLFLYGDSPYESCYRVIAPYKRTRLLTRAEIAFNCALSSDRISIEQAFGYVTSIWRVNSLDINLKALLQPVAVYYAISVFLTNIRTCLRGNVVLKRYKIQPPLLEDYLLV